jgi:tetratricopeptide (TPR) repeat protein
MWLFLAVVTLLTGCAPPGPRALLDGKRLLEQGKYPEAIEQLRTATVLLGGTNALAFNYLGLACHQAGEFQDAERAYQRALALNHELTEIHFNLGCLWLTQRKLEQAKAELTAYTLRRANVPEGWLKLGAAQFRAGEILAGEARSRELGAAEKSFSEALHLSPQNPEALTGLGLVRLRRGHANEAAQFFSRALKEQPDYSPALLNLAVVAQSNLNDRQLALEKYRGYAALKPAPDNLESVTAIIRQLEQELNPPPTKTAALPIQVANNVATSRPTTVETQRSIGASKTAVPESPRQAATVKLDPSAGAVKAVPAAKLVAATQVPAEPSTNPESVKLPTESALKSTFETQPVASQELPIGSDPVVTTSSVPVAAADPKPVKRGFFHRINPFESDHKQARLTPLPAPSPGNASRSGTSNATNGGESSTNIFARYTYHLPTKLPAGNRSDAERALALGVQTHQAQHLPEAIQAYGRATQLDPSFYNAWFNLGLAAGDSGNLAQALGAYENALTLRPDSVDARYRFALTLKQANYVLDATNEFEKILVRYPNESRAHLALGNIYSQQLHQPAKARQHYLKVLEIDPRNPQAGAIRYWLTDNPG